MLFHCVKIEASAFCITRANAAKGTDTEFRIIIGQTSKRFIVTNYEHTSFMDSGNDTFSVYYIKCNIHGTCYASKTKSFILMKRAYYE